MHERTRVAPRVCPQDLPGPARELVFRELRAYADFGYRIADDGLIPRLATAVLATRSIGPPIGPLTQTSDPGEKSRAVMSRTRVGSVPGG
ncbi:hypothetical protein HBB16_04645 [Pseudonocardia sp. MCCB 268]|nr:hypothetical protein [Pseudonocardia cytotoxica]